MIVFGSGRTGDFGNAGGAELLDGDGSGEAPFDGVGDGEIEAVGDGVGVGVTTGAIPC